MNITIGKIFKLIKAESIYKRGMVIKRRFLLVLDKFINGVFLVKFHFPISLLWQQ